MTEQHSSFGGVAVADPRATSTSPLDLGTDTEGDDNRRKLALVGAVVAVLVVLVAAFFMLKGGGSSDNTALPPHIVPPASSTTAQSGTAASAPKAIKLPKPFAGAVGRDPFKPLYVAPADVTLGGGTGTPVTPVNPVNPAPVVTVPTTTGTPTSGPSNAGGGVVPAGYAPVWVALVHVNGTQSATFVVGYSNGKRSKEVTFSNVAAPKSLRTVFANVFSLLSIQNGTTTVQIGDGTPFDLGKGFNNRHYVS